MKTPNKIKGPEALQKIEGLIRSAVVRGRSYSEIARDAKKLLLKQAALPAVYRNKAQAEDFARSCRHFAELRRLEMKNARLLAVTFGFSEERAKHDPFVAV